MSPDDHRSSTAHGTVLVLEPESSGIDLLAAAARLGLRAHVLDRRPLTQAPRAVRDLVGQGRAGYSVVDTRSEQRVIEAATVLARRERVVGVVPGFEYAVPVAASVAAALGLPGLTPAAAARLRHKGLMKAELSAAGVAVASGVPLRVGAVSEDVLLRAAATVGFPAVVKPVDGSGSLGVLRVDSLAALRRHLEQAAADGALDDMGLLVGEELLLESYVAGPEFSVEGWVSGDGEVTIASVTEKLLGPEPYFVEVGHIVDADQPQERWDALSRLAQRAVAALDLAVGVFHLEARLTPDGPVVMEIAARLGGDRIHRLVSAVHGRSLPEAAIRCLTGLPQPLSAAAGRSRIAASVYFTAARTGRIADPAALRNQLETCVRSAADCRELSVDCAPGAQVGPASDFRQRFGHAVLLAPDRRSLTAVLAEVADAVDRALDEAATLPALVGAGTN